MFELEKQIVLCHEAEYTEITMVDGHVLIQVVDDK
jgi:hypothetical protein